MLFVYNLTTTWSVAPVSVTVSTIAPDVPVPLVNDGPIVVNELPLYTFNCPFVVSHQRSPVTLLLGVLALAVLLLTVLNDEPL